MTAPRYHEGTPPVGVPLLVWVWYLWRDVAATWDGATWRDELGRLLPGPITHWREA